MCDRAGEHGNARLIGVSTVCGMKFVRVVTGAWVNWCVRVCVLDAVSFGGCSVGVSGMCTI